MENNRNIIASIDGLIMALYGDFMASVPIKGYGSIDSYFHISIGRTPPRNESKWFSADQDNNYKWLSISDMGKNAVFVNDTSEYLIPEAITNFRIPIVKKGTVILSFKLTIGKVLIAGTDMVTNEAIAQFSPTNADLTEFLYCYLRLFNFDELGSTSSIATAVNSKSIKAMPFPLIDQCNFRCFHERTKWLFEKIDAISTENERLLALKTMYLKQFFG